MRAKLLGCALLVLLPSTAGAEWQVKPFVGVTFGGTTTYVTLEEAVGEPNWTFGGNVLLVGEVLGIEGDVGISPGFFGDAGELVTASNVTTMTGNLYIGLPRRWFQYTLRPYVVGGGGVIRVRTQTRGAQLEVDQTLPAWDVGGGATGFLNERMGVSWELRYFRGFSGDHPSGVSFGSETLSFFRAMMALTIRLDRNVP